MNYRIFPTLAALALAAVGLAQTVDYMPGEVLVKFKKGYAFQAYLANRQIGARSVGELEKLGVSRLALPNSVSIESAVQFYKSRFFVDFAEPNGIMHATGDPNDPFFSTKQYAPQIMQCPAGWDITTGSASVVIAILDTGTDYTHEDIVGKTLPGYDFIDNDNDPQDTGGHGTHVSGIAAAHTNNNVGIAGVGYNCKILPVRVLGPAGGSDFQVASGITYAADNGAKVINMSLGRYGTSTTIEDAINYAWNNGVVVVAAAGNDNVSNFFIPAAYDNCIAVGSTDQNDQKSSFSNFSLAWCDVAAPGSSIYSTVPLWYNAAGYEYFDGTSMASPQVAGVAGLVWSKVPAGTSNQVVRDVIEQTCDPVGLTFWRWGRVNALKALQAAPGGGGGTVTSTYPPTAMSIFEGQAAGTTGGLPAVTSVDNVYLTISSISSSLGQVGTIRYDFKFDLASEKYSSMDIQVSSRAPQNVAQMVWAWNYATGRWDYIGAYSLNFSNTDVMSYKIKKNADMYINKSAQNPGTVSILVRGTVPNQRSRGIGGYSPPPFSMRTDVVRIKAVHS